MNQSGVFSKTIVIAIVLVLLVGAGIAWAVIQNQNKSEDKAMMEDSMQNKESDAMMENKSDEHMTEDGDKMKNENMPTTDGMMNNDKEDKMDKPDAMMQKSGSYKDYSVATVEAEQKAGNKVVLFFHAPWCPFCKAANEVFTSRTSEIPAGVTVLKTDYDSNSELKQKYGVTYQHTFVQIDSNENQVSKWNGGDIDNLKKYLK